MRDLSLLLDVDEQCRRDQQQSDDFLHRRDRRLALEHGIDGGPGTLPTWLHAVRGQEPSVAHGDPRLRAWHWARVLFVVAGIALGAAAMLGLLYYDGGRRINVTLIIGVALLQLLLAVLTTLEAWVGWQPWHAVLRDLLARWWPAPSTVQPALASLSVPLAARVAQSGGLAFGLAALATLLTQVVVHDLAFGWSTTLQASAPAYHTLTTALAWPWRGWLPGAVPSLALVEQSRYFHVGTPAVSNPELLGIWWRFLAMLWACYVVVPRIALLGLARLQLQLRVRRRLRDHPGRIALHQRCTTPWVDNGDGTGSGKPPSGGTDPLALQPATPGRVLIRWADAGDKDFALDCLGADAVGLDAGGSVSLDDDARVLETARTIGGPVIVLTRGWEPPTGELADFLERACAGLGRETIQLIPLAAGRPRVPVDGATLAPWRRFVERLRQPGIVIADLPGCGEQT